MSGIKISREAEESPTLKIGARAKALIAKGYDVVNLTAGEPDFEPPEHARTGLEKVNLKYSPGAGLPALREAVKARLTTELNLQVDDVVITNGGKGALGNAIFTMTPMSGGLNFGITSPYWPSYKPIVEKMGNNFATLPTDAAADYKVTPDQLRKFLQSNKIDAFIFTSPGNPTSSVYTRVELEALAEVFREFPDCVIISDDIYSYWIHGGNKFVNLPMVAPDLKDRCLILDAFSKSMAIPGQRVGYAAGPKAFINAMINNQGHFSGNPNNLGQAMALAILKGDQGYRKVWGTAFESRAHKAVNILQVANGLEVSMPGGGIYCYPSLSKLFEQKVQVPQDLPLYPGFENEGFESMAGKVITDSGAFGRYLFAHYAAAIIPGTDCEDPNGIRVGIAASDKQVEEGANRIVRAINTLQPA